MTAINKGWSSKPTAGTDTAGFVAAERNDHVHQIASRIAALPKDPVGQKKR